MLATLLLIFLKQIYDFLHLSLKIKKQMDSSSECKYTLLSFIY